jgi:hypothetical protein
MMDNTFKPSQINKLSIYLILKNKYNLHNHLKKSKDTLDLSTLQTSLLTTNTLFQPQMTFLLNYGTFLLEKIFSLNQKHIMILYKKSDSHPLQTLLLPLLMMAHSNSGTLKETKSINLYKSLKIKILSLTFKSKPIPYLLVKEKAKLKFLITLKTTPKYSKH